MNWTTGKNGVAVERAAVPVLSPAGFDAAVRALLRRGQRPVAFFGHRTGATVRLYCVTGDDETSALYACAADFTDTPRRYAGFTPEFPAFHLFEREVYEEFGLEPAGHPSLKPVRRIFPAGSRDEVYPFTHVAGEDVHEVGVGPIHAGVIEPGHFRFSCRGEKVERLEIHLGYQRRGVEDILISPAATPESLLRLAESIAGDSTVAHGAAFLQAWEGLAGAAISPAAEALRAAALELERAAVHIGDLGALSGDVAYLPGNAAFGAVRTGVINTLLEICGSRFGRGLLAVGGCHYTLDEALKRKVLDNCARALAAVERTCAVLFSAPSVLARFESTGVVSAEAARRLGLVGPAARASGVALDVRADYPAGAYAEFPVHRFALEKGSVFSRAYIRYIEIKQSLGLVRELLGRFPAAGPLTAPVPPLRPDRFIVSLVEGWRGQIVHVALTDAAGNLERYKIIDPSFHNWSALEEAVRGEGISDFPLCNKSFNLSYCGYDL